MERWLCPQNACHIQHENLTSVLQHTYQKLAYIHACTPNTGKEEKEGAWGSLAS